MTADVDIREQRLRKQAELQSLYTNLTSLRDRENSYIVAQAAIPELLVQQIIETRQKIEVIESDLFALDDETIKTPARQFYRKAFEAELSEDVDNAIKLYRSAARYAHPDASAAIRSLRYRVKIKKTQTTISAKGWGPLPISSSKKKFPLGLFAALLILILIFIFALNSYVSQSPAAIALDTSATLFASPSLVTVIVPNTSTPIPTVTPIQTSTLTPTATAVLPPPPTAADIEPTPSPTSVPPLKGAPKIIGPRDGLVWNDGAVVFEFEDLNLPDNELYCLDIMRGYDKTLTENWSFPPVGSKTPRIPIEANVFRIAQLQDISCITWSAYIARDSCDNVVGKNSEKRVIGLPQPCGLK